MTLVLLERLAAALAVGLLIGIERGWRDRDVAEGGRAAGVRTFALIGLLGGVAALLGQALSGWAFAALALPVAAALIVFKAREQAADHDVSATAVVAGLLVFALGALAMVSDPAVAAAAGVATAGLLAAKPTLHAWLRRLSWPELRSGLVLLAMTLIVWPLLPNRGFGPFGAINPAELWLMTIAMATVSFVAYAALRIAGPVKGAMVASAAGALVSSTAVTYALARRQRQAPQLAANLAGVIVAGAVMAGRVVVLVAVLAPSLLSRVAAPLAVFAVISTLLGLVAGRAGREAAAPPPPRNPFDLEVVLKFAIVLGAISATAKLAAGAFGAKSLIAVAMIGGLADVDAVTLTASRLARAGLDPAMAALAILLAVGVDSVSKLLLAWLIGGRRFGAGFALATLAAGTGAGLAAWMIGR